MAPSLRAYDGDIHQQLTFIATKQLDRCIEDTDIPLLTPLEIRYMVKGNVGEADRGWFTGLTQWQFYDHSGSDDSSWLWLVETRVNARFQGWVGELEASDGFAQQYSTLGKLINNLQNMSSPAYAVPVYYSRWWRLSTSDRFNNFPVDHEALERALENSCTELSITGPPQSPTDTLRWIAQETIAALNQPIPGMSATWTSFWEPDRDGGFGSYGPAGNSFGRRTEFDCPDPRCRLRDGDSRYQAFALQRHRQAVIATMKAMYWKQWHKRERLRGSSEP